VEKFSEVRKPMGIHFVGTIEPCGLWEGGRDSGEPGACGALKEIHGQTSGGISVDLNVAILRARFDVLAWKNTNSLFRPYQRCQGPEGYEGNHTSRE
jgi:hypothetical protein